MGQSWFLSQNNNLQGDKDELRTSGASPIFGRHRVALGCSGLHANSYFTAERNSPHCFPYPPAPAQLNISIYISVVECMPVLAAK